MHEDDQNEGEHQIEADPGRRAALQAIARFGAYTAPAMMVLLKGNSANAQAAPPGSPPNCSITNPNPICLD